MVTGLVGRGREGSKTSEETSTGGDSITGTDVFGEFFDFLGRGTSVGTSEEESRAEFPFILESRANESLPKVIDLKFTLSGMTHDPETFF
ncbi:hypothetical protein LIER_29241 [Lithospermum erythrorhizon]|uniref:Uncharacterized protein n=1 Tax=Lithospermum erythrorhizon TaxID=34254 RepID=A0AAV3RIH9_LITER